MVGSIGDRMLDITLPHVDSWNMWWSQYGNSVEGFRREKERVDSADRSVRPRPDRVEATAAVLVQLDGGIGRLMGDYDDYNTVRPLTGYRIGDSPTSCASSKPPAPPTSNWWSTPSPEPRSNGSPTCSPPSDPERYTMVSDTM